VVSGETGGGKSLLITALKILRGEKVPGTLVRHGAEELQVDGEFRLGKGERSAIDRRAWCSTNSAAASSRTICCW
jgi:DNA repair ATPase RecN